MPVPPSATDPFDSLDGPEPDPSPTGWEGTDSTTAPVRLSTSGLTIELSVAAMLQAIDPAGRYLGYDPDADEDRWEPTALSDLLVHAAALELVKQSRKAVLEQVQQLVNEQVREQVAELVRTALEQGTLQRTNEWGGKVGEPQTLQALILQTATDSLTKPVGDSMRAGRQTMVQKIISDAVGTAWTKELRDEVSKAKGAAQAVVREQAAAVLQETIERAASKGLSL